MSRLTFDALYKILEKHIFFGRSTNGKNILPKEKLLVFLYVAGGNSYISYAGDSLGISDGSIVNCIRDVTAAFYEVDESDEEKRNFIQKFIQIPSADLAKRYAKDMLN